MDGSRFDGVTRLLAAATTRRGGFKAALGVVFGGAVVVAAGEDASAAQTRCRRGRQTCQRNNQCCSGTCQLGRHVPLKDRNRCTCEDGTTQCGNACVDTTSDARNCGACGVRCGAAEACCDGECLTVVDDAFNCGACGEECESGPCFGGACLASCPEAGTYWHPVRKECMTAEAFCESDEWFVGGERAECMVTPDGELEWTCDGTSSSWDWGDGCQTTADCQEWCDTSKPGNVGCMCVLYQYYVMPYSAYPREDYTEQPWCVVKTGDPFGIDEVLAGTCGNY